MAHDAAAAKDLAPCVQLRVPGVTFPFDLLAVLVLALELQVRLCARCVPETHGSGGLEEEFGQVLRADLVDMPVDRILLTRFDLERLLRREAQQGIV